MDRGVRALLLLMMMAVIIGAAQQAGPAVQPSVNLPADLARVLGDYEAAWQSGDAAGLARLFAEDGFVLPNGGPPVRSRAAIQKTTPAPADRLRCGR